MAGPLFVLSDGTPRITLVASAPSGTALSVVKREPDAEGKKPSLAKEQAS
jgi:hypothetical protein